MILISFLDFSPKEIIITKCLAQFLNWINRYYQKNDREYEILVVVLRKNAKKGLGPSINISIMAWNFEVKFDTQPYFGSRNSCAKNQPILRGW